MSIETSPLSCHSVCETSLPPTIPASLGDYLVKHVKAAPLLITKPSKTKTTQNITSPSDIDFENPKVPPVGRFYFSSPLSPDAFNLLLHLCEFFNDENLARLIVPRSLKSMGLSKSYVLSSDMQSEINGISLRAIEWLLTNYSKGLKIILYNHELCQRIDIHQAYESQSNHYKRNLFDPFCRHDKIFFKWRLQNLKTEEYEDVTLLTTIGQLNFMKWADVHSVLQYAKTHQQQIQEDMERTLCVVSKEKKKCKSRGEKRKRKELTKAPNTSCLVYNLPVTFDFGQKKIQKSW